MVITDFFMELSRAFSFTTNLQTRLQRQLQNDDVSMIVTNALFICAKNVQLTKKVTVEALRMSKFPPKSAFVPRHTFSVEIRSRTRRSLTCIDSPKFLDGDGDDGEDAGGAGAHRCEVTQFAQHRPQVPAH